MHIIGLTQTLKHLLRTSLIVSIWLLQSTVQAAPSIDLLEFWVPSNEKNTKSIDHSQWQVILDKYLIDDHPTGINRFNYQNVNSADKTLLENYVKKMQALDPRGYSRPTQKAYWINLYNALTVNLILKNYPVDSITKISEGFFSFGPWDDKVATIQGQSLTLNNIEHGILRPIWRDNRIHYAVNCASIGCPNLSKLAFTKENTESILDKSAKDYVNHSRGVKFEDNKIIVSSIYHWYKVDFGDSDSSLLKHLQLYANKSLKNKIIEYRGEIYHTYNWELNKP